MDDGPAQTTVVTAAIDVVTTPACVVCGDSGVIEIEGARDTLYGVPGRWTYRRCRACGLLWQDPMVAEQSVAVLYERYHTHTASPAARGGVARRAYAALRRGFLASEYGYPARTWERAAGHLLRLHPGRRADADFDAIYLPARRRGRLLDVGCGRGETMERLAALGWDVRGLDVDRAAVEVARGRGMLADLATVWSDALEPGTFDVIWMSHVVEHVHRPVDVLARCGSLLAHGGVLVAVTPNSESWGARTFGRAWRGLEPPRHLQVFSRLALGEAARRAGFCKVEVQATIRNARGIHGMSRAMQDTYALGTIVETAPAPTVADEIWQLREWLRTFRRPEDGEELVLHASPAA